jgi:thiol-disulfide isomerase/thioredoxin
MNKNRLLLGALALGLTATSFGQATKYVVVEEKTGTWCGFCPYGFVTFAQLEEDEPNFIGIAIHNSDPMANSYYDTQSESLPAFGGYPYACADRVEGGHAADAPVNFNDRITENPVAAITAAGYVTGDQLEIRIKAVFDTQTTGDWRLAAVVTEDGVTGTGSGYNQANYFEGGGYGPLSGDGRDWHTSPNPVPASEMVYNHVARVIADNAYEGVDASLPATMNVGTPYWYSYYVTISDSWDLSNLHVVAMLVDPSGEINNAGKGKVGTVGITEEVAKNFSISAYPNPTNGIVNLTMELSEASNVSLEVVNILGEVVTTIENQNLAAGTQYNQIDLSNLTEGVYFVKTTVNGTVEMTRIVVQK